MAVRPSRLHAKPTSRRAEQEEAAGQHAAHHHPQPEQPPSELVGARRRRIARQGRCAARGRQRFYRFRVRRAVRRLARQVRRHQIQHGHRIRPGHVQLARHLGPSGLELGGALGGGRRVGLHRQVGHERDDVAERGDGDGGADGGVAEARAHAGQLRQRGDGVQDQRVARQPDLALVQLGHPEKDGLARRNTRGDSRQRRGYRQHVVVARAVGQRDLCAGGRRVVGVVRGLVVLGQRLDQSGAPRLSVPAGGGDAEPVAGAEGGAQQHEDPEHHALIGRQEDEQRAGGRIKHAEEGEEGGDAAGGGGRACDDGAAEAGEAERHVLEGVEPERPAHLARRVAQLVAAAIKDGVGGRVEPGERRGRERAAPGRLANGGADTGLLGESGRGGVDGAVAYRPVHRPGPHARRRQKGDDERGNQRDGVRARGADGQGADREAVDALHPLVDGRGDGRHHKFDARLQRGHDQREYHGRQAGRARGVC
eukprot:scaffold4934_cov128-Isochrysis_galbana.AAC.4